MEKFRQEATENTPFIDFDHLSGNFKIAGRSFPANAFGKYRSMFSWLDEYIKVPLKSTELNFNLDYINTSSLKVIMELLRKLGSVRDKHHTLKVIWYYEKGDDETKEVGNDLQNVTSLPFEILEKKEH